MYRLKFSFHFAPRRCSTPIHPFLLCGLLHCSSSELYSLLRSYYFTYRWDRCDTSGKMRFWCENVSLYALRFILTVKNDWKWHLFTSINCLSNADIPEKIVRLHIRYEISHPDRRYVVKND